MTISREYVINGRRVSEAEYGRYVADHLNEWLAEAWERGHEDCTWPSCPIAHANPYDSSTERHSRI